MRIQQIVDAQAANENPYPHKYNVEMSITEYIKTYGHLVNDQVLEDKVRLIDDYCVDLID